MKLTKLGGEVKAQFRLGLLTGVVFLFSALAFAGTDYDITNRIENGNLFITIQEKQVSMNACDLYVERFEYFHDLNMMDVKLVEIEKCPLDVIGHRKAYLQWHLPFGFSDNNKSTITLRINGIVRGRMGSEKPEARGAR